jgi:hypothetical protein
MVIPNYIVVSEALFFSCVRGEQLYPEKVKAIEVWLAMRAAASLPASAHLMGINTN